MDRQDTINDEQIHVGTMICVLANSLVVVIDIYLHNDVYFWMEQGSAFEFYRLCHLSRILYLCEFF